MTAAIMALRDGHAAAEAVAAYAPQLGSGWVFLVALVLGGVMRLLMEWQLRRTLAEIFRGAPGGSVVVVRKRGLGGSMWIQVGPRAASAPTVWRGRAELR
jgi:hypothetical protein